MKLKDKIYILKLAKAISDKYKILNIIKQIQNEK